MSKNALDSKKSAFSWWDFLNRPFVALGIFLILFPAALTVFGGFAMDWYLKSMGLSESLNPEKVAARDLRLSKAKQHLFVSELKKIFMSGMILKYILVRLSINPAKLFRGFS